MLFSYVSFFLQIKPVNTPCREAADECDFVEFCTGNESMCVPDTYARNGEPCASGDAFCYDGRCRSTNKHCSRLIGEGNDHSFPCSF